MLLSLVPHLFLSSIAVSLTIPFFPIYRLYSLIRLPLCSIFLICPSNSLSICLTLALLARTNKTNQYHHHHRPPPIIPYDNGMPKFSLLSQNSISPLLLLSYDIYYIIYFIATTRYIPYFPSHSTHAHIRSLTHTSEHESCIRVGEGRTRFTHLPHTRVECSTDVQNCVQYKSQRRTASTTVISDVPPPYDIQLKCTGRKRENTVLSLAIWYFSLILECCAAQRPEVNRYICLVFDRKYCLALANGKYYSFSRQPTAQPLGITIFATLSYLVTVP